MRRTIAITMTMMFVLCAGCETTKSTARQLDRQIKYIESLEKVHTALTDKLAEVGEQIEQGKKDLEALRNVRSAEEFQEEIAEPLNQ